MCRRGVAIGLVVIIITLLFVAAFTILRLMQGAGQQMSYADSHLRALTIAESAIHGLTARMMAKPWEDRWFKDGPDFHGTPIDFCGGSYVYIIHDSPGTPKSADIWVRASYRKLRRIIFYRVHYQDLLFHGLIRPDPTLTTSVDDTSHTGLKPTSLPGLTEQVTAIMKRKSETSGLAAEKWQELAATVNPAQMLQTLGARVPEGEIALESVTRDGRSAKVYPRPVKPIAAKSEGRVRNYDKWSLFFWIGRQGYDADFAASLRSKAIREFSQVDRSVAREKYLEAEQTLKKLLMSIYTNSAKVNFELKQAKTRYQSELAAIDPSLPPEQQSARRRQISQSYQAERRRIIANGGYS